MLEQSCRLLQSYCSTHLFYFFAPEARLLTTFGFKPVWYQNGGVVGRRWLMLLCWPVLCCYFLAVSPLTHGDARRRRHAAFNMKRLVVRYVNGRGAATFSKFGGPISCITTTLQEKLDRSTQWRREARARQVKWPGWKASALAADLAFALAVIFFFLKYMCIEGEHTRNDAVSANLPTAKMWNQSQLSIHVIFFHHRLSNKDCN